MSTAVTNSVSSLVQSLGEIPPESVVFGQSETMQALRSRLDKVAAATTGAVLFLVCADPKPKPLSVSWDYLPHLSCQTNRTN